MFMPMHMIQSARLTCKAKYRIMALWLHNECAAYLEALFWTMDFWYLVPIFWTLFKRHYENAYLHDTLWIELESKHRAGNIADCNLIMSWIKSPQLIFNLDKVSIPFPSSKHKHSQHLRFLFFYKRLNITKATWTQPISACVHGKDTYRSVMGLK